MNKHFLAYAVGITLCMFASMAHANRLGIKHWDTENGVPVYFVALPDIPMVDLKVVFKAGAIHNGELHGLAPMTAALMRTGTPGKDVLAINKAISRTGANIGIGAGIESMTASIRSLTDNQYLDPALDILLELLTSPTFPQDEIELYKKRVLQTIRTQNENPSSLFTRFFNPPSNGNWQV